ncbi:hypothetical protein IMZ48_03165, partial [Candidatus Bathyarchaeota archaeon]|nr:hypothetical protein [Candidatus Bathyarchaeota archaeon]
MSNPFSNLGRHPDVSTPERPRGKGRFAFGTEPTTTPAGPPPSARSFTPAGAPSPSFLDSSIMRGMGSSKQSQHTSSGSPAPAKSFGRKEGAPIARPARNTKGRGPSALSQSMSADNVEPEAQPATRAGTFRLAFGDFSSDDDDDDDDDLPRDDAEAENEAENSYDDEQDQEDDADAEGEDEEPEPLMGFGMTRTTPFDAEIENLITRDIEAAAESDEGSADHPVDDHDDDDLFLDLDDRQDAEMAASDGTEEDLMLLTTPAADARARKEAENIFRASSRRPAPGRRAEFEYGSIAREHYSQQGRAAIIQETPNLILETEDVVSHLYDEGIGAKDDAEKLDSSLAMAALRLTQIWNDYAQDLGNPEEEYAIGIGPGVDDDPFKKAAFVADLVIRMHHTRFQDGLDDNKRPPLPEVLFRWMKKAHNPYPDQVDEVIHLEPNPTCHTLFWQTVRTALVRGEVALATDLLRAADFGYVRGSRGAPIYTGKSLDNIQYAVKRTCDMLDTCPGARGDWNILGSDWTLFRVKARASLDQLKRFAEGRDQQQFGLDSYGAGRGLAGLARKAESKVPWEVYEQLNTIYDIAIGDDSAILETAQDWCEATIGLYGWWDEGKDSPKKRRLNLL